MKREEFSLMIFPFGYDLMQGTMSMQDIFDLTAQAGIPTVDVLGINRDFQPACRDAIDKSGVKVYCFIACISFFQEAERIREDLERDMDIAGALDAQLFMIVPYVSPDELGQAAAEGNAATRERMAAGFRIAVELGEARGLKVCFETTPHDETALSGTEDCAYVLQQVPGLGLVFDTANMLPHGDDTLEAYEALKDYIIYVHLKDVALAEQDPVDPYSEHAKDGRLMRGVVWGDGVIPVREIASRLRRDGYGGPFAVEYAHPGQFSRQAHLDQMERFMRYFDA